METLWQKWADVKGYCMACCAPDALEELNLELEKRRDSGEIDSVFFQENLTGFSYLKETNLPKVRTIIVLAIPRPAHKLTFNTEDGPFAAVLPPTYIWYTDMAQRVKADILAANFFGEQYQLVPIRAPLKLLAARLGLVQYGRNNIAYTRSMGSYLQLFSFATDAELGPKTELKQSATVMPECAGCSACLASCPMGAIKEERFLLHAERCLTHYNEHPGTWPDWIPDSVHHCLVGCLICQKACPQNSGLFRIEELEISFTKAETAAIFDGQDTEGAGARESITSKLAKIGLSGYEPVIGRNLRALLYKEKR